MPTLMPAPSRPNVPTMEKPLLGAVLCCTSIAPEDRTRLARYAEQMGAEHKLDLTSDVTHLLVGSTDTPKYQYVAREREDVKVLRPEWVEAVRQCWMEDQPLDMNALEAEYRVPILVGLKICITGFDDLTFRAQLSRNVATNGGEYTGDLTKDVTHLIAAKPEGKKYEYATLWQKKVVSLQWYKDTLERGMQLDENSYHPSRPPDEQGVGAWNRQNIRASHVGKRPREEQAIQEPARKLRRTASAKLSSQSDNMWGDIVGRESKNPADDNHLRTTKSMSNITDANLAGQEDQSATLAKPGFLSGLYFVVVNFDKRKADLVNRTLHGAGATVVGSLVELASDQKTDPDNTYIILPHETHQSDLPSLKKLPFRPTLVTELWLERCMLQKNYIPPRQYPLGGIITKIIAPEIEDFTLNATGFQSIETLHIAKTVARTGAKYVEQFTPKSSVLVCNSMNLNQQKLFHANQWRVPAVSENWLCEFLTSGSIPKYENYLIGSNKDEDENDLESELKQRRVRQNKREPPDADEPDDGSTSRRSMSTHLPSSRSKDAERSRNPNGQNTKQSEEKRKNVRNESVEEAALREISPNSPSRRERTGHLGGKKSLFKMYDGASSAMENQTKTSQTRSASIGNTIQPPKNPIPDTASINSAIQDLLDMKARAKAEVIANQDKSKGKKQRLLGRALSNLSNASLGSRQSRASSVDSLNTDGIGSEIAPPSGRSNIAEGTSTLTRKPSLQARVQKRSSSGVLPDTVYKAAPIDLDDPHLLRDELEAEEDKPQLTQLGYEDSEEAIALREKLAEKRRARGRLGQNDSDPKPEIGAKEREALKLKQKREKQVIKDDETLTATGWGGGMRTRGKNRSADLGDLEMY